MLQPLSIRMVGEWIRTIPVEIEEKHDQVKTKLDKGFLPRSSVPFGICQRPVGGLHRWQTDLLVYVQFPEDLGRIKQMLILEDPMAQLL